MPALRIKDWLILAASRGADFLSEKRVSGIYKTEKPLMQLLVSVRDAREATDALDGGAAIIDVKEPARGSLALPIRSVGAKWPRWSGAVCHSALRSVNCATFNLT